VFAACALFAAAPDALAAGRVSLQAGQLEFAGLAIDGLELDVAPSGAAAGSIRVRAASVRGLAATGPLSRFALDCPDLRVTGDVLRCNRGRLAGALGSLGVQDTRFDAERRADGSLMLAFDAFGIAGGRGRVEVEMKGATWRADANLAGLDIGGLAEVAKPLAALPAGFAVAGRAGGTFRASGAGDLVRAAGANLTIESLDFSDEAGSLAGEKVAGTVVVDATADATGRMPARGRVVLSSGQAYSDPVFLDFGAHQADLAFDGVLDTSTSRFDAKDFRLDHADVLEAAGSATIDFAGETLLPAARVRIGALELGNALPAYAQPFLLGTSFKDIAGGGSIRGDVEIDAGLPVRATLDFEDVAFDSPTSAVSLTGLGGRLNWYDDASRTALAGTIDDAEFESRLAWKAGRLWGLELGPASLPFATTGRHFRLLEPVMLPVFDGGLAIDTLRVRHAGTDAMYVRFDAEVKPISVSLLSRAFGWPEFQGTLEGRIPGLQLRQGVVTLDGALEARVFDGRVAVKELRLQDPLGKFPRLFANIGIENLDLELVTRTFEFGTITGRMSGYVSDLETFGWMPEAFDAFLFTPPDDDSRHRISQRAVTNLSSIGGGSGGGVAAALQGGFLRFFDDFRYDRLGLSCRLANDVCLMGGVLPAPGGYYIVKGAGLPRINVIGSQSRVAWTTLVRQLGSIVESEIVVQ
ncbi:MAG TPA: hypothetical protein VJ814_11635, partial [Gaiellaceae bacterium]|nr:hypothetical protein [Gaiellaceae bacterium]